MASWVASSSTWTSPSYTGTCGPGLVAVLDLAEETSDVVGLGHAFPGQHPCGVLRGGQPDHPAARLSDPRRARTPPRCGSCRSRHLAACDAFITEGQHACGGVFQMNAECVVKFPNHTDDPGVGHPRPPGHRDWASLAGDPAPAAPAHERERVRRGEVGQAQQHDRSSCRQSAVHASRRGLNGEIAGRTGPAIKLVTFVDD